MNENDKKIERILNGQLVKVVANTPYKLEVVKKLLSVSDNLDAFLYYCAKSLFSYMNSDEYANYVNTLIKLKQKGDLTKNILIPRINYVGGKELDNSQCELIRDMSVFLNLAEKIGIPRPATFDLWNKHIVRNNSFAMSMGDKYNLLAIISTNSNLGNSQWFAFSQLFYSKDEESYTFIKILADKINLLSSQHFFRQNFIPVSEFTNSHFNSLLFPPD